MDKECLSAQVRRWRTTSGSYKPTEAKVEILSDGSVGEVRVPEPVPYPTFIRDVERAFRDCEWIPGTDPKGKAMTMWYVMPFRFDGQ